MSNKNIIVAIANKNKQNFEGKTPTEVHNIIKNHPGYKQLLDIWSPEEVVIFIFLLVAPINDLSVAYDVIKIQMYGYQIIQILDEDPDVDCDYCDGAGYNSCEECNGVGEVSCEYCDDGEIECDACDSSGEDGDGDKCEECNGKGYVKCEDCDGSGHVNCGYCENGDTVCRECDGDGSVVKHGSVKYEGYQILTYNPEVLNMFENDYTKVSEKLYLETTSKYYNLLLKDIEYVTDEFTDNFDVDDVLLIQIIEHDALNLKKNAANNILCDNFNLF